MQKFRHGDAIPRNGMRSTGIEKPSFGSVKINRCCARDGRELARRDQSFLQKFKLRPVLDGDSEVDIAGGASRPQSMNIYQNEVARRRACEEVFALGMNRAIGSSTRNTRTTDGSTALFSGSRMLAAIRCS